VRRRELAARFHSLDGMLATLASSIGRIDIATTRIWSLLQDASVPQEPHAGSATESAIRAADGYLSMWPSDADRRSVVAGVGVGRDSRGRFVFHRRDSDPEGEILWGVQLALFEAPRPEEESEAESVRSGSEGESEADRRSGEEGARSDGEVVYSYVGCRSGADSIKDQLIDLEVSIGNAFAELAIERMSGEYPDQRILSDSSAQPQRQMEA